MRKFFRFTVGVFFIFFFILFLGLTAIRFRLLNYKFWSQALGKAGVYQQLAGKVSQFAETSVSGDKVEELRQRQKTGQLSAQEQEQLEKSLKLVEAIEGLDDVLTAEKIQELVEENLKRFLTFIKDKKSRLVLYLPIGDLGLPDELTGQQPLSLLTAKTDVEEYFTAIGQPDQAEKLIAAFEKIRNLASYLFLIWVALLVLVLVTLSGHFFLGQGKVRQIRGTSLLLLISGLSAAFIAFIIRGFVTLTMSKADPAKMPPVLKNLLPAIIAQFFNLGQTVGIIVALIGLIGVAATIYFVKSGKIEIEKSGEKEGKKAKGCLVIIGVLFILGVVILVLGAKFVSKIKKTGPQTPQTGLQVEQEGDEQLAQQLKLSTEPYVSDSGWSMLYPQGWQISRRDEVGLVGFFNEKEGAFVAVEISQRPPELDSGSFLPALKNVISSGGLGPGFPNSRLIGEPRGDDWQGWKRFIFVFDYDYQSQAQARQLRKYIFPPKGGDGFLLYAQSPVTTWSKFEAFFNQAVDSFSKI